MEVYNSQLVIEAWKQAVNTGVVDHSKLRPEIACSWERCIENGLDPWSMFMPQKDEELLKSMREKYSSVIEAEEPVLQYLLTVFNCNCSIANKQSFIFDLITPLSSYPRTLGTYTTESICGNGNITIALYENKPYRVDGYEHFRAYAQGYSGVASPVRNLYGEDFILCINNPFSSLPENALDVCINAAELIEKLAKPRREVFTHLSSANFFDPLIESAHLAIVVTDMTGNILTANSLAKALMPGYEKQPYGSVSLNKYLKEKSDLDYLLGTELAANPRSIDFKGVNRGPAVSLKAIRAKNVKLINGLQHHIIVFETPQASEAENKPATRETVFLPNYIGESEQWKKVDSLVRSVAPYNANVMIMGDTGTGKEVIAQALHRLSGRTGEFVAINCGGLPRELLSSELFGYESGAFTGARSSGAMGKFEYANGGTLFLDEIGDMPVDMQVSLLRVIQEQCITRIGANKSIPINVRIIAATNQNVKKLIASGRFRSDLWYRLSVIEIHMPTLKERRGDVPLLAEHFNKTLSKKLNTGCRPLSPEVLSFLDSYSWPGNVRELRNVMEKALIIANGDLVRVENFPESMSSDIREKELVDTAAQQSAAPAAPTAVTNRAMREQKEREKIIHVLEEEGGNITRSAKRLNISRNTLYRKIEKMDIQIKVSAVRDDV